MNVYGQLKQAQPELFTVATLPSAVSFPWRMVFATDAKKFYISDGTAWLEFPQTGSALPSGVILPYGGVSAPIGFLLCNGQSYLRSAYPGLFAAIGTTYGSVDSNSFNVPDLRGFFVRGLGGAALLSGFIDTAVDTSLDTVTMPNHGTHRTGTRVVLKGIGTPPAPLSIGTIYFAIVVDANTIKFASSYSDAIAGNAINLTTTGDSVIKQYWIAEDNAGTNSRFGPVGGSSDVFQNDEYSNHTHSLDLPQKWGDVAGGTSGWGADNGNNGDLLRSVTNSGGLETRPRNVSANYIIAI